MEPNRNHHIWCNNGTYFIHLTLLWQGQHKRRLRVSLKTRDVAEARRRRDRLLATLRSRSELTVVSRSTREGRQCRS